jgi:Tol biopolymer transport system component
MSRWRLAASALTAVVAALTGSCSSGDQIVDSTGTIAFVRSADRFGGPIFVVAADGSGLRRVTGRRPRLRFRGISWSPEGRTLVATGLGARTYDKLFVISLSSGAARRLTHGWPYGFDWDAVWSPDGRTIAFDRNDDGYNWIYVIRADGAGERRLTPNFTYHPAWSPSRRIAYFDARGIWVMRADGSGKRRLVRTRIAYDGYETRSPLAWSPDGALLAYSTGSALWLVNADGSNRRRIFSAPSGRRTGYPVWSPDGTKIAQQGQGGIEIFAVDVAAGEARKLTDNEGIQGASPSWSPDSRAIAYVNKGDVFVMNADGTGTRNLTNSTERESEVSWSP